MHENLYKKRRKPGKKSNFLNIVFSDNTETRRNNQTAQKKTETKKITDPKNSKLSQTETRLFSMATQAKLSGEQKSDNEVRVSRMDPTKTIQKETSHNEAPPTMTKNKSLEASHELITEGVVATIERSTMTTETEEDTPLFRKKTAKGAGSTIHCRGNKERVEPPPTHQFRQEKGLGGHKNFVWTILA